MALSVPALLDTRVLGGSAQTIATNSITPSTGVLLVVWAACADDITGVTPIVTTTLSNVGAWTIVGAAYSGAAAPGSMFMAYAVTTGSPAGAGTVTADFAGNHIDRAIHIAEIGGYNRTSPVRQSKLGAASTTGTTYSFLLTSTPFGGSCVFAGLRTLRAAALVTPGAAFTELAETVTTATRNTQSQYDLTSATTTVDWSNLANGNARIGLALEVVEAETHVDVTIGDVFALTDAETSSLGQAISDVFGITDTETSALGAAIVDPFGLTDAESSALATSIADPFGLTDVASSGLSTTVDDQFGFTDSESSALGATVNDPFGLSDSTTSALGATVTDQLGLSDSAVSALGASISDPLGLADSQVAALGASIVDGFGAGDDVGVGLGVTIDDLFGLTDEVDIAAVVIGGLILCAEIVLTAAHAAITLSPADAEVDVSEPDARIVVTEAAAEITITPANAAVTIVEC